jgi:DNA-binding protein Fis
MTVESLRDTDLVTKPTAGATLQVEPRVDLDPNLLDKIDGFSLENLVDVKIGRFLDQLGKFYPEGLYDLIMSKVEKPLIGQILKRTGGNQVHASRILGINRNTLRKKMKIHGFAP